MKQRIRLTESQLHNVIRKCVNEALSEGQYGKQNQAWVMLAHLTESENPEEIADIMDNREDDAYLDNLCAGYEPMSSRPINNPWQYPHGGVILDNDRYAMLVDNNKGELEVYIFAPYDEYF